MKQRLLKFKITGGDHMKLFDSFYPQGQTVLNATEWRGKEPRSCGVTGLTSSGDITDVTVSYRPKGCITFVGDTRYNGWTAVLLDRNRDGTLLDGHGKPLKDGEPLVYVPVEVYPDTDFNRLDFGAFVEEIDGPGVDRTTHEAIMADFRRGMSEGRRGLNSSVNTSFMAQKRQRPSSKIVLTTNHAGEGPGPFGDRFIYISTQTPHLQTVIEQTVEKMLIDFVEGRISLVTISDGERHLVDLNHAIVDCTPNEIGKESRFDIFNEYVSADFLEGIAIRLMSNYRLHAVVVEGKEPGLLFSLDQSKARSVF